MARPLRVNIADGWYHCMHRGLERREIFAEAYGRAVFLRLLGEAAGGMDYAAVCMDLRRFSLRLMQQDKGRELNDNYKRILEMLYV